jgi:type IV pilus assembly protein PilE
MGQENNKGFTLIELVIVVAVIGILLGIAVPQYADYVIRAKIQEATSTLADLRLKAEQFFADNRTYVGFPCTPLQPLEHFDLSCGTPTAAAYTFTMSGRGSLAGFTYTINQANLRTSSVPGGSGGSNCWIQSKGGSC